MIKQADKQPVEVIKQANSKQPDEVIKQVNKQPDNVIYDSSGITHLLSHSKDNDEASSTNAEDLLTGSEPDEAPCDDNDDDYSRSDNTRVVGGGDDDVDDDNVSVITTNSTKSKKKADAEIQAEAWNYDMQKLNAYRCNCEEQACTQNATINQVVYTRESLWGKTNVTSKMRRQMIFTLVASARMTKKKEFRCRWT